MVEQRFQGQFGIAVAGCDSHRVDELAGPLHRPHVEGCLAEQQLCRQPGRRGQPGTGEDALEQRGRSFCGTAGQQRLPQIDLQGNRGTVTGQPRRGVEVAAGGLHGSSVQGGPAGAGERLDGLRVTE